MCDDQACWVLYCDLVCLNYDGNLLDACATALVAALGNGIIVFTCVLSIIIICFTLNVYLLPSVEQFHKTCSQKPLS